MAEKISFGDFEKVDLRVGIILEIEEHPNADKLFVLKVDLGEGRERTVCAGLRGFYSAEELKGKQGIFVVNLEPRNLRGVESDGMILAVSSNGEVKIIKPKIDVKVGEIIKVKNSRVSKEKVKMISIEDFKKVNLKVGMVDNEKVIVVADGDNVGVLVANGVPIVPDGEVEEGSRVS